MINQKEKIMSDNVEVKPVDTAEVKVISEVKAEEKKEPVLYRGKDVEISSLAGTTVVPVQIMENVIPPTPGNYGGKAKIPKLSIITNVAKIGNKLQVQYVNYLKNFALAAVYMPMDFKVRVLTGGQGKDMIKKYSEHRVKNLGAYLALQMTIGSDYEIFVQDEGGNVMPAFTFLGTKAEPTRAPNVLHGHNKISGNGCAAEFDTVSNVCLGYHCDSVQIALAAVIENARKRNKNAKLSNKTVIDVPYDILQTATDEQMAFGYKEGIKNAYGLQAKTVLPRSLPFRSAAAHIHFGIGNKSPEAMLEIVKALDAVIGVCCVSLFSAFDNPIRREFSGLPGEHRIVTHGLEYRGISNEVLSHPTIMHLVFDLARKVVALGANGLRGCWDVTEDDVISIMLHCDVPKARSVMERNKNIFMTILKSCYTRPGAAEAAYDVFMSGMEKVVDKPDDIEGNWMLNGGWKAHSHGNEKTWASVFPNVKAGRKI